MSLAEKLSDVVKHGSANELDVWVSSIEKKLTIAECGPIVEALLLKDRSKVKKIISVYYFPTLSNTSSVKSSQDLQMFSRVINVLLKYNAKLLTPFFMETLLTQFQVDSSANPPKEQAPYFCKKVIMSEIFVCTDEKGLLSCSPIIKLLRYSSIKQIKAVFELIDLNWRLGGHKNGVECCTRLLVYAIQLERIDVYQYLKEKMQNSSLEVSQIFQGSLKKVPTLTEDKQPRCMQLNYRLLHSIISKGYATQFADLLRGDLGAITFEQLAYSYALSIKLKQNTVMKKTYEFIGSLPLSGINKVMAVKGRFIDEKWVKMRKGDDRFQQEKTRLKQHIYRVSSKIPIIFRTILETRNYMVHDEGSILHNTQSMCPLDWVNCFLLCACNFSQLLFLEGRFNEHLQLLNDDVAATLSKQIFGYSFLNRPHRLHRSKGRVGFQILLAVIKYSDKSAFRHMLLCYYPLADMRMRAMETNVFDCIVNSTLKYGRDDLIRHLLKHPGWDEQWQQSSRMRLLVGLLKNRNDPYLAKRFKSLYDDLAKSWFELALTDLGQHICFLCNVIKYKQWDVLKEPWLMANIFHDEDDIIVNTLYEHCSLAEVQEFYSVVYGIRKGDPLDLRDMPYIHDSTQQPQAICVYKTRRIGDTDKPHLHKNALCQVIQSGDVTLLNHFLDCYQVVDEEAGRLSYCGYRLKFIYLLESLKHPQVAIFSTLLKRLDDFFYTYFDSIGERHIVALFRVLFSASRKNHRDLGDETDHEWHKISLLVEKMSQNKSDPVRTKYIQYFALCAAVRTDLRSLEKVVGFFKLTREQLNELMLKRAPFGVFKDRKRAHLSCLSDHTIKTKGALIFECVQRVSQTKEIGLLKYMVEKTPEIKSQLLQETHVAFRSNLALYISVKFNNAPLSIYLIELAKENKCINDLLGRENQLFWWAVSKGYYEIVAHCLTLPMVRENVQNCIPLSSLGDKPVYVFNTTTYDIDQESDSPSGFELVNRALREVFKTSSSGFVLNWAIKYGLKEYALAVLANSPPLECERYGKTPLVNAVANLDLEIVRMLVSSGVSVRGKQLDLLLVRNFSCQHVFKEVITAQILTALACADILFLDRIMWTVRKSDFYKEMKSCCLEMIETCHTVNGQTKESRRDFLQYAQFLFEEDGDSSDWFASVYAKQASHEFQVSCRILELWHCFNKRDLSIQKCMADLNEDSIIWSVFTCEPRKSLQDTMRHVALFDKVVDRLYEQGKIDEIVEIYRRISLYVPTEKEGGCYLERIEFFRKYAESLLHKKLYHEVLSICAQAIVLMEFEYSNIGNVSVPINKMAGFCCERIGLLTGDHALLWSAYGYYKATHEHAKLEIYRPEHCPYAKMAVWALEHMITVLFHMKYYERAIVSCHDAMSFIRHLGEKQRQKFSQSRVTILRSLIDLYVRNGDIKNAIKYCDECMCMIEGSTSEDAQVINELREKHAACYEELQKYDQAIMLYNKCIASCQYDHQKVRLLIKVGDCHFMLDCLEEALNQYNKAVQFANNDDVSIVPLLKETALYMHYLYQYNEALDIYGKLSELTEKFFGKESVEYAEVFKLMGRIYACAEDYSSALIVYQKSFEIRLRVAPVGDLSHLDTAMCIADCLERLGKPQEAKQRFDDAMCESVGELGKLHPDNFMLFLRKGDWLYHCREYVAAISCFKQALRIQDMRVSKNTQLMVSALLRVGESYMMRGRLDEAYRKLCEAESSLKGLQWSAICPDAIRLKEDLGDCFMHQGLTAQAREYYLECQAVQDKTCHEKHSGHARVAYKLAETYRAEMSEVDMHSCVELYKMAADNGVTTVSVPRFSLINHMDRVDESYCAREIDDLCASGAISDLQECVSIGLKNKKRGQYVKAYHYLNKVLTRLEEDFKSNQGFDWLALCQDLAECAYESGYYEASILHHMKAIELCVGSVDRQEERLESLFGQGECMYSLGSYPQAQELYAQYLDGREKHGGLDAERQTTAHWKMVSCLFRTASDRDSNQRVIEQCNRSFSFYSKYSIDCVLAKSEIYYCKAQAYMTQELFDLALGDYIKSLKGKINLLQKTYDMACSITVCARHMEQLEGIFGTDVKVGVKEGQMGEVNIIPDLHQFFLVCDILKQNGVTIDSCDTPWSRKKVAMIDSQEKMWAREMDQIAKTSENVASCYIMLDNRVMGAQYFTFAKELFILSFYYNPVREIPARYLLRVIDMSIGNGDIEHINYYRIKAYESALRSYERAARRATLTGRGVDVQVILELMQASTISGGHSDIRMNAIGIQEVLEKRLREIDDEGGLTIMHIEACVNLGEYYWRSSDATRPRYADAQQWYEKAVHLIKAFRKEQTPYDQTILDRLNAIKTKQMPILTYVWSFFKEAQEPDDSYIADQSLVCVDSINRSYRKVMDCLKWGDSAEVARMLSHSMSLGRKQMEHMLSYEGEFVDSSGRKFTRITILQYALWAWDMDSWEKIISYMGNAEVRSQIQRLEEDGAHLGEHYDFNGLFHAYEKFMKSPSSVSSLRWIEVGDLQKKAPPAVLRILFEKKPGSGGASSSEILRNMRDFYESRGVTLSRNGWEQVQSCGLFAVKGIKRLEDKEDFAVFQEKTRREYDNLKEEYCSGIWYSTGI